jgi:hypothetical protein
MDNAGIGDGGRQAHPIVHDFAVQIDRHVFAQRPSIIQDIRPSARIANEYGVQHRSDGAARDHRIRAGNVALDVGGEGDLGHGYNGMASNVSILSLSSTAIRSLKRYVLPDTSILSK